MKNDLPAYAKPGALQVGIVLTLCVLFLIFAVYIGLLLMAGEPVVENFLSWTEEIRG